VETVSGSKRHDWPGLIQEWVFLKGREPLLSQAEFFRRKGITAPSGNRKIGKQMTMAWEQSQNRALSEIVEKSGINLAEELERQFKASKTAFAVGARYILPRVGEDGREVAPLQQPANFTEALMLMRTGAEGIREITKILTGGEPLVPPRPVEAVIEWVPPKEKPKADQ
jgi:hypothetical protein